MFFPREHYLIFFSQATKVYTPSTKARPSQLLVCCSAKQPAEALALTSTQTPFNAKAALGSFKGIFRNWLSGKLSKMANEMLRKAKVLTQLV